MEQDISLFSLPVYIIGIFCIPVFQAKHSSEVTVTEDNEGNESGLKTLMTLMQIKFPAVKYRNESRFYNTNDREFFFKLSAIIVNTK